MEILNREQNGLRIFDNFSIDYNLPKHKRVEVVDDSIPVPTPMGGSWAISRSGNGIFLDESFDIDSPNKTNDNFFTKLFSRHKRAPKVKYRYTVEEFFKSIKNSAQQLKRVDERIESFNTILEQAKNFGQTALAEKIQDQLQVIRSETQLYAINLTTVITEEQIVKFVKDTERGLRLDWIQNFTRVIPNKLLKLKQKADDLKIFDNYVILHYDPNGKNTQLTKKEIEKKKDPILFGVIQGSNKLYYVGDWVDEYCDLTLETLVDKFGKDVIHQNDITATIKGIVD